MATPIEFEWLMTAHVQVRRPIQIGNAQYGYRQAVPIGDGYFAGPSLRGTVIPGSADWQLIQRNGIADLDVTGAMLTDDGVTIRVSSKGMRHGSPAVIERLARGEVVHPNEYYMRAVARFEAPEGSYDWLNKALFVSWGERYEDKVVIHYYKVLGDE
jgi:hypothetical protein